MHAIYSNKTADANCRQFAENQTDKLGLHATRCDYIRTSKDMDGTLQPISFYDHSA
jgi:hypothetical protein